MSNKVEQTINLLNSLAVQCPDIPVIYQKRDWNKGELIYPLEVIEQVIRDNKCSLVSFPKKKERVSTVKFLLDEYTKGSYSIYLLHIGLYIINRLTYSNEDYANEKSLGQKRYAIYNQLPKFSVVSIDEFFMYSWQAMVRKVADDIINPPLNKIRLLIDSELFSDFTGIRYEADIVEPISRKEFGECRTFTSEKDPMAEQSSNDGYLAGDIYLSRDAGGYRHFVKGIPLNCGSRIEVKFGDGWIPGRYECSLSAEDKRIRIYSSSGEYFTIPEGSLVRIKR